MAKDGINNAGAGRAAKGENPFVRTKDCWKSQIIVGSREERETAKKNRNYKRASDDALA
jgi:hypothetical protein